MQTTASILDDVNVVLMEKAETDMIVNLTQCRMKEAYLADFNHRYELHTYTLQGHLIWDALQSARRVDSEIYDHSSDTAYEKAYISLYYYGDPNEEVVKPPVVELEPLLFRLTALPHRAQGC
jgi:hypothetical protein